MHRALALGLSILTASSAPALAQGHPGSHERPASHGAMQHSPLDSAGHAAIHAALVGNWTGTMSPLQGGDGDALTLSIAHDSLHAVMMTMHAAPSVHAGAARDFHLTGTTLDWTQEVSGKPCRATAIVGDSTHRALDRLNGTITCEQHRLAFTLRKAD